MEKLLKLPDGKIVKASLRRKADFNKPSGTYSGTVLNTSKIELGFFVSNRELFVFMNDEVFRLEDLTITNTLQDKKISLSRPKRVFRISKGSRVLIQEEYPASKNYDVNPFWPTEEEDEDDLLWFTQVLSLHERRLVLLEKYREAEKSSA